MYDKGHGVPQNYGEAVKWLRLAVDQGFAEAQWALDYINANGSNWDKSCGWISKLWS